MVARAVGGQLAVQPLPCAVGTDQLVGNRADPCFSTEQQACNRGGIQALGLGTQATWLGALVRLTRMQHTQPGAVLLQQRLQVLAVAPRSFQSNQNALRGSAN